LLQGRQPLCGAVGQTSLPAWQQAMARAEERTETFNEDLQLCRRDLETVGGDLSLCRREVETVATDLSRWRADLEGVGGDLVKLFAERHEAGQPLQAAGDHRFRDASKEDVRPWHGVCPIANPGSESGSEVCHYSLRPSRPVIDCCRIDARRSGVVLGLSARLAW